MRQRKKVLKEMLQKQEEKQKQIMQKQIQKTQVNKSKVVSQLKTRAKTKQILAQAKSLASVKKQPDEEADARKESLQSVLTLWK